MTVDAAGQADDDWLADAVHAYQRSLILYTTSLVGDAEVAREVVQEAFFRLWRQQRRGPIEHPRAWLFRTCRNHAFDVLRKDKRMRNYNDDAATDAPTASPHDLLERADLVQRLMAELSTLSPGQQEIVRLKFQQDLSYDEIASITGKSANNVGVTLYTALRTLRDRLNLEAAAPAPEAKK